MLVVLLHMHMRVCVCISLFCAFLAYVLIESNELL